MSVSASPSIFDVFNARQLTPQEVAGSFVPPPHFSNLAKSTHTLIVGPRGSGKTTLLKMLHPAALEAWRHEQANAFRRQIKFTGVFVATDINWSEQVRSLGDGRLDSDTHKQFVQAAFTTQILQSLVESMMHRAGRYGPAVVSEHRRARISERDENKIARELIGSWHIDRALPTFEGVKVALSRRLSQIRVMASQEAARGEVSRGDRIADTRFLHLDFLASSAVAVEVFNAKSRETGARWALLFDELELAPQWIRSRLVRFLRSVDERFLFKISLSPYSVDLKREMEAVHSAGAKQDFEPIRLWYVNKEHGYPFCRQLLKGMLEAREIPDITPEQLFGTSAFATEREEWSDSGTAYRPDSSLGKQFKLLSDRDPSFRDYLKRREIDLRKMTNVDGTRRAADLRKARSIVALRSYFRGLGSELRLGRGQGRRSRKVPTVYGGATSLFAMLEGNPRWFIGIVGDLLNRGKTGAVPRPMQVRHVLDAADIFRAMLKTIPCGPIGESRRGLLSLLDPVGEYFAHATIDGPFDPDPPCSFIVDQDIADEELRALGMALNAGAIVYAPDEGEVGILESLRGKRFRLSYVLAPHYCIPLVLGRSMSLREILKRAGKQSQRNEPTLFSPLEEVDE